MPMLVIWASPNLNGLTALAKDRVVSGIVNSGNSVQEIHLNSMKVRQCIACNNGWGRCRSEGHCILADDFMEVYDKIRLSSGVVWITPVYWHDIAECLKTFLDRLRRCETGHNHFLRGKRNMLVACAGGTGRGAIQCLVHLETILGHMEMISLERLPVIRFNQSYMLATLSSAGEAFAKELVAL